MIEPDTSDWRALGATTNTKYFEIERGVLACVPHKGATDTEVTASENITFQNQYLAEHGPGFTVIYVDMLAAQDKGARRVYKEGPDRRVFKAAAMVGGSMLSRAMVSFFIGLSKPQVPIKMFPNLETALSWGRALSAANEEK